MCTAVGSQLKEETLFHDTLHLYMAQTPVPAAATTGLLMVSSPSLPFLPSPAQLTLLEDAQPLHPNACSDPSSHRALCLPLQLPVETR